MLLASSPSQPTTSAWRRLAVVLAVVVTMLTGWLVPGTSAEAKAPAATQLSIASIPASGGKKVTITGKRLSKVKAVYVGSTKVKVTHPSKTKLRFTAPSHAIGTAKLRLLVGKKRYATSLVLTYVSDTPGASAFEAEVFRLTNVARTKARTCGSTHMPKAAALTWSTVLAGTARAHSADMASQNYFDHTSKDGRTFDVRITQAGYKWNYIGENIAAGQPTPAAVVAAWIKSAGHCENLMSSHFTQLGVGYATGGSYGSYWTQDFGRPAS